MCCHVGGRRPAAAVRTCLPQAGRHEKDRREFTRYGGRQARSGEIYPIPATSRGTRHAPSSS